MSDRSPFNADLAAAEYPSRRQGESDRQYLKRIAHALPMPKWLPEQHDAYFALDNSTVLTLGQLRSSKSHEENQKAGENAAKFMAAARACVVTKRAPIPVRSLSDGLFLVVDGN